MPRDFSTYNPLLLHPPAFVLEATAGRVILRMEILSTGYGHAHWRSPGGIETARKIMAVIFFDSRRNRQRRLTLEF